MEKGLCTECAAGTLVHTSKKSKTTPLSLSQTKFSPSDPSTPISHGFGESSVTYDEYDEQPEDWWKEESEEEEEEEKVGQYTLDDGDYYIHKATRKKYHIKSKGDLYTSCVIVAASKLYRLLLGDEHAVLADLLDENPETGEKDDVYIVKEKLEDWIGLGNLTFPLRKRSICIKDGQLIGDEETPQTLVGLRALSVVAWFLGESDMHSMNFGFCPAGHNSWNVVVIDPSGTLEKDNLKLPIKLVDFQKLPGAAPAGFNINDGHWHLLGDGYDTLAPTVGIEGASDEEKLEAAAIEKRKALENIKTTPWSDIKAILDEIQERISETKDFEALAELTGRIKARHKGIQELQPD